MRQLKREKFINKHIKKKTKNIWMKMLAVFLLVLIKYVWGKQTIKINNSFSSEFGLYDLLLTLRAVELLSWFSLDLKGWFEMSSSLSFGDLLRLLDWVDRWELNVCTDPLFSWCSPDCSWLRGLGSLSPVVPEMSKKSVSLVYSNHV
jgi:hypothetical protein